MLVTVKRTNGHCEASATTAIAGSEARLHWIYVKLRWPFGIGQVLVRGSAGGRPVEELIEISPHRRQRRDIVSKAPEDAFTRFDMSAHRLQALAVGRTKDQRKAGLGVATPLSVATSGCLQDRVQPRLGPQDQREIDIDPGLDQGCGDHPRGTPLL